MTAVDERGGHGKVSNSSYLHQVVNSATIKFISTIGFSAISCILLLPLPAFAATWNWSFSLSNGWSGGGTLETAGPAPAPMTLVKATSISGAMIINGISYAITGFSNVFDDITGNDPVQNQVAYSLMSPSRIITGGDSYSNGLAFETAGPGLRDNHILRIENAGFVPTIGPVDIYQNSNDDKISITSSSFALITPPAPPSVPGPLPVLGAAASYAWARRIRKRIREN